MTRQIHQIIGIWSGTRAQSDGRQNGMQRRVPSAHGQPVQAHGHDKDQNRSQHDAGHGDERDHDRHGRPVEAAIVIQRG